MSGTRAYAPSTTTATPASRSTWRATPSGASSAERREELSTWLCGISAKTSKRHADGWPTSTTSSATNTGRQPPRSHRRSMQPDTAASSAAPALARRHGSSSSSVVCSTLGWCVGAGSTRGATGRA
nr:MULTISPECIES: hypothetical protein [unclassified Bacteroides]